MLTLIILSLFAGVMLLSASVLYPLLSRGDLVRGRVARLISSEEAQPRLIRSSTSWQRMLSRMGGALKLKPADLRSYRRMLTAAGFRSDGVYLFLGCKLFLAGALPAGALFLSVLHQGRFAGSRLLLTVACSICGYLLPTLWLRRKAEQRKTEIFHSLPDVLDLLTVCVEAGLSLNAALIKTTENFQQKDDPLIREITIAIQEIRVGKPRSEAMKGLAERTMVDDVRSFVTLLLQTEKFGTTLGGALRCYSDSLRTKRRQLAEEQAAQTAVKMLFPLVVCVFPALLVVILTPAFFKLTTLFGTF